MALPAEGLLRPGTRATDAPGTTPYFFKPPWQRREEERLEPVEDPTKDCPPELNKVIEVGLFFEGAHWKGGDSEDLKKRTINKLSKRYPGPLRYYTTDATPIAAAQNIADAKEFLSRKLCETATVGPDGKTILICGELKIDLFGYSQGAIAALALADDLQSEGLRCVMKRADGSEMMLWRQPMPVRFLGVLDPVATGIWGHDPGEVPSNVENFWAAYASDDESDRLLFGESRQEIANPRRTVDLSPTDGQGNHKNYVGLDHTKMGWEATVLTDLEIAYAGIRGVTPWNPPPPTRE
ncbi:MAG: hypothetical protein HUU15_17985 [Candidatus Brocadiae bacterium]|nr:hypothetical protein [Candidatus Brocadiia bacterium]